MKGSLIQDTSIMPHNINEVILPQSDSGIPTIITFDKPDIMNWRREARLLFYVIAYDIISTKRRNKLHRLMKKNGINAQRSVFECDLQDDRFSQLYPRIRGLIEPDEDDVRVYYLCQSCVNKIRSLGKGEINTTPDLIII